VLARILLLTVLGGIIAGLIGGALAWLIHRIQFLATGLGVVHPVVAAGLGGVLAGAGWWLLRRHGPVRGVEDTLLTDDRLPLRRTVADALLQILAVGSGVSLGREQAPRQASAAVLDALARRFTVPVEARRLLIGAAAGAGLAAVYNVPLAGLLFAVEVLPGRRTWRSVAVAALMSAIATVTAWLIMGIRPIYRFPEVAFDVTTLAWLAAAVPLTVVAGRGFLALVGLVQRHGVSSPAWLPLTVGVATAGVVAVSFVLPGVTGNGELIVRTAFDADSPAWVFLALLVAKPLLTAFSLGSGAVGGTLTPALAVGAALGGLVGVLVGVDPGLVAVFALIGAAGVLAVMQQSPLFAAVIAWELTWAPWWTLPLLVVVAVAAYGVDRWVRSAAAGRRP